MSRNILLKELRDNNCKGRFALSWLEENYFILNIAEYFGQEKGKIGVIEPFNEAGEM